MADPPRFLTDRELSGPGRVELGREESHHGVAVLRLRPGDDVVLFDGRGRHGPGKVAEAARGALAVDMGEATFVPRPPPRLTIATAVPKGKRWQALVEKCTELGVDRIIPLLTVRSVVKPAGNGEKWRRWSIEAAKQSRRAYLPEFSDPIDLASAVELTRRENALLLIADIGGDDHRAFSEEMAANPDWLAVIGPEGGLTDAERELCLAGGGKPLRLSPFVLRVETAAAAMCALMKYISRPEWR